LPRCSLALRPSARLPGLTTDIPKQSRTSRSTLSSANAFIATVRIRSHRSPRLPLLLTLTPLQLASGRIDQLARQVLVAFPSARPRQRLRLAGLPSQGATAPLFSPSCRSPLFLFGVHMPARPLKPYCNHFDTLAPCPSMRIATPRLSLKRSGQSSSFPLVPPFRLPVYARSHPPPL
jgi:hypothetical protein